MSDKVEIAQKLSEEILSCIENESMAISSIALRCLRLARLIDDELAIEWLTYETCGYPNSRDNKLQAHAFQVASAHGRRGFTKIEGEEKVFTTLAPTLESFILTSNKAIEALSVKNISLSGDMLIPALREHRTSMASQINSLMEVIIDSTQELNILRGEYYRFVVSVNYQLRFSHIAEEIFRSYRQQVDTEVIDLAPEALKKFSAAFDRLSSDNPESWSQALTSCRRILQEISNSLFDKVCGINTPSPYVTQSGKSLDITGDKYRNKLFAVVDKAQKSQTASNLVGSNIIYLVDYIECLDDELQKGVHVIMKPLSFEDARMAILHTYIIIGDVLNASN